MKVTPNKIYHVSASTTRTLTNISNIQYANPEGTAINCDVMFKEFPFEQLPYTADMYDPMAIGREIFKDIKEGLYGLVGSYVEPEVIA